MRRRLFYLLFAPLIAIALLDTSCANRGIGPQGGPKDSIPPVVVVEQPTNGSIQCQPKKIEVQFDEYIQLDNVQQNLLICPPQQVMPVISAVGKKLTVELQDPLQDSTTYTLDFGRSICDYHEKNPMAGYLFAFATGDVIDSLQMTGYVLDAATLNPMSSLLVGVHSVTHDSAFTTLPFVRVARTDSTGHFVIRNMRAGQYRLYALRDVSRDYRYQPGESLAFSDSLYTPYTLSDTVPAEAVLWHFAEDKQRHYFQRAVREEAHRFTLLFSAPQDRLPRLRCLPWSVVDSTRTDTSVVDILPYIRLQANPTRDTLVYWLTDSVAIRQDSIVLQMSYTKTDSAYQWVEAVDTVKVIYRATRMTDKAREAKRKADAARRLEVRSNASKEMDLYDTIRWSSLYPLQEVNSTGIRLYRKQDTVRTEQDYRLVAVDSAAMRYQMVASLVPGAEYVLRFDSAALRDIYGVVNHQIEQSLKLKRKEDYASLKIHVSHAQATMRLQLLSERDELLSDQPVRDSLVVWSYLKPATYYLRLYEDANQDGRWTTGDWMTGRQPERVYYFPSKLKLRANWDFEETFDYSATPQTQSKPKEIRKDGNQKK